MVDLFALGITHALLALALWRLVRNDALDRDPPPGEETAPAEPAPPPPPVKGRLRA